MFRFALMLALCVYGNLGCISDDGGWEACKKDMWIVWDNSWSVGKSLFNNEVRPFLKKLMRSPLLNVAPDGTHVGIITFSTEAQTKVLLEMGEKNSSEEIINYLDGLKYENISGDGTRTGMALKIVDEKFSLASPKNYRKDVDDVLMILTDGQPIRRRGERTFGDKYNNKYDGERLLAKDRAKSLRDKNVTVVGLAVGSVRRLRRFAHDIKEWSTKGKYFEADKKSLQNVLDKLIDSLCPIQSIPSCTCGIEIDVYARGRKTWVRWIEPRPRCGFCYDDRVKVWDVYPNVSSPAEFGIGKHTIVYTYRYMSGVNEILFKCPVNVYVHGRLCGGVVFDTTEVCCYGKLHKRRPGYECCGFRYYETRRQTCQDFFTIFDKPTGI